MEVTSYLSPKPLKVVRSLGILNPDLSLHDVFSRRQAWPQQGGEQEQQQRGQRGRRRGRRVPGGCGGTWVEDPAQ